MGKMINPQFVCDEDNCEVDISECYACRCGRCETEPSIVERYHACENHKAVVDDKHFRVRGTVAWWSMFKSSE